MPLVNSIDSLFGIESKYVIPQFSNAEIKEHFADAIKSQTKINSAVLDSAINKAFDEIGQKIRFGNKKENELCWYGEAGYVKSFKTGEIIKWGINNIAKNDKTRFQTITKAERELKQKQALESKKRIDLQKLQERAAVAKKAEEYFNSYSERNLINAATNQYLINKNIADTKNITGIKFTKDNQIVIPVRDINNKIHTLQYIDKNGNKKFLKNGEKQGNFFLINKNNSTLAQEKEIYLAEGFATAASVHQATDKPVVVCFDSGNIEHVLKNLKSVHPDKPFTILADNDIWKDSNTGKDKAITAAKKYGAKVILPEFKGINATHKPTDFNDLHKLAGIEEVRKQIANNHVIEHHISINQPTKGGGFDL